MTAPDFPSPAPCFILWSSCLPVSQSRDSCQPGSQRSPVKTENSSDTFPTSAPLPWDVTLYVCVCVWGGLPPAAWVPLPLLSMTSRTPFTDSCACMRACSCTCYRLRIKKHILQVRTSCVGLHEAKGLFEGSVRWELENEHVTNRLRLLNILNTDVGPPGCSACFYRNPEWTNSC